MSATGKKTESHVSEKRPRSRRRWIVMAGVGFVVLCQIANGVFVKSISAPGGAKVTFFPRSEIAGGSQPYLSNTVDTVGRSNYANIAGGRDNHITQSGTHNFSHIGPLSPSEARMFNQWDNTN